MDMDYIDIDHVYDIPDTPDRVTLKGKSNGGCVPIEIDSSVSAYSNDTPIFGEASPNQLRGKGKSKLIIDDEHNKRLSFDSVKRSKSPSTGNAHLFRKTMTGEPANTGNRFPINSQRKDKGISVHTTQSSSSRENAVVDLTEHSPSKILEMVFPKESRNPMLAPNTNKGKEKIDKTFKGGSGAIDISPPRACGSKRLVMVRNGRISPQNTAKDKQEAENNINGSSNVQNGEVKRLSKNGFISRENIAKNKQVVETDCNGSINVLNEVASHGSDSSLAEMRELVSEDGPSHRERGLKRKLSLAKEADRKNMPSRQHVAQGKDLSEPSTSVRDALKSLDARGGWRNTHALKTSSCVFAEDKHVNQQNGRNVVKIFDRMGSSSSSSLPIERHKGSSSSNHGENSSLSERPRSRLNNCDVGTSSSVIEIDESPSDVRCNDSTNRAGSSDDSYAKAMQLEADEMLALKLQEEMYNEMSQVRSREIDAHIALALQEEETSQASASFPVSRSRVRGSSNSTRRSQSRSSQNQGSSSTRSSRLRRQVFGRPPRMPVGRRSSVFPPNMDLDMRMHILEALEAFSDMGIPSNVLQADRDFNENDYEMLLGLDENNHQHTGTSVNLINSLPQSTVQNGMNTEDCAICLETPTIGDEIRHLPCLHKFHKDCIDPWLRRNTSCPVCKSSVT